MTLIDILSSGNNSTPYLRSIISFLSDWEVIVGFVRVSRTTRFCPFTSRCEKYNGDGKILPTAFSSRPSSLCELVGVLDFRSSTHSRNGAKKYCECSPRCRKYLNDTAAITSINMFSRVHTVIFDNNLSDAVLCEVGVKYRNYLVTLEMHVPGIRDISSLGTCTCLRSVDLDSSGVECLTALKGCSRLEHLILSRTNIKDIEVLSKIPPCNLNTQWATD